MSWKKLNGQTPKGVKVIGDPTMPATRWWNIIFLLLFYWKKVVIFKVLSTGTTRFYMVGFKSASGEQKICTKILFYDRFAVKVERENYTFFAYETSGDKLFETEIPIIFIGATSKKICHLISRYYNQIGRQKPRPFLFLKSRESIPGYPLFIILYSLFLIP